MLDITAHAATMKARPDDAFDGALVVSGDATLLFRDLRLAVRAGGGFGLALAFFLILVTLVPFGVGPDEGLLSRIAPGILWVGALLASLLSLDRHLRARPGGRPARPSGHRRP